MRERIEENDQAYHVPTNLPIPLQHIPNNRPRRLHVRNRKQAMIVFILRVHNHEHAVLRGGFGGLDAEKAV